MPGTLHILNGDELDEELLAEALGRTGISDYVERGLRITEDDVDFGNAVVDVPGGKAYVLDNGRDAMLLADPAAGVALGTDGTNHIYIAYDAARAEGEKVYIHVSQDQTPPSDPALRIATIDMAAETVTPKNDNAPVNRRDATSYKGNDIDPDGDGRVAEADEAFVVQAANINGTISVAQDSQRLGGEPPTSYLRTDVGDDLGSGHTADPNTPTINYALDTASGEVARFFEVSTDDTPTIVAKRVPAAGVAFEVRDRSNDTPLFTLRDDGDIRNVETVQTDAKVALTHAMGSESNFAVAEIESSRGPTIHYKRAPGAGRSFEVRDVSNDESLFVVNDNGDLETTGVIAPSGTTGVRKDMGAGTQFTLARLQVSGGPTIDIKRSSGAGRAFEVQDATNDEALFVVNDNGDIVSGGSVEVGGGYLKPPTRSDDPNDPPNGAEWINTSDW